MCLLTLSFACQHGFVRAVACPGSLFRYNKTTAKKLCAELFDTGNLGPEFGCKTHRGHVLFDYFCPFCTSIESQREPALFVRETPLLPGSEPPTFSIDWRPATVCEWFRSFFADLPDHPKGEAECCKRMELCTDCTASSACRHPHSWSRIKYRPAHLSNDYFLAWPCELCPRQYYRHDFLPAPFDLRVIVDVNTKRTRPSPVKRISSFLSSKMHKDRPKSPPPPSRQDTLDWVREQARIEAEKAREEKARKEKEGR